MRLKRAYRTPARGVWGIPPRKLGISDLLRSFLGMKLYDLMLNLVVVFEAHRIKGVALLWATEAAEQLVICISTLILIA